MSVDTQKNDRFEIVLLIEATSDFCCFDVDRKEKKRKEKVN